MDITVSDDHLLDLLEECLPIIEFAVGGIGGAEETLGKVKFMLKIAERFEPLQPHSPARSVLEDER